MKTHHKILGSMLIALSLGSLAFWLAAQASYEALQKLSDFEGYESGYSHTISLQLFGNLIRHSHATAIIQKMDLWLVGCLLAHCAGFYMLWSPRIKDSVRVWYFAAQPVLFISGILGVGVWMTSLIGHGWIDGEFVDEDPFWASAFALWVVVSSLIAFTALVAHERSSRIARRVVSENALHTLN